MARIDGVSKGDAGLRVKLAYFFTRRQLARLTGREPEHIIEPLELYAHAPGLMFAYGKLEGATAEQDRVDWPEGAGRAEGRHAYELRVLHRPRLAGRPPLRP
jgi:hypothetical protein